jgi:ABC-type multidrug transport system fused ATPase/permease subunit
VSQDHRGAKHCAVQNASSQIATLREALQLLWSVADRYTQRRLLLALALVVGAALIAALAPIALKLAVDSLSAANNSTALLAPVVFVLLYVLGQYLVRAFTEVRQLMGGRCAAARPIVPGLSLTRLRKYLSVLPVSLSLDVAGG